MTQDTHNNEVKETEIAPPSPNHPPGQAKYVKLLLVIVIVLGIILVSGLAVVIGTIIKRFNDPQAATRAAQRSAGFGEVSAQVPQNARLINIQATNKQLILHLQDKEGDFLLLLDMRTGAELGRIRLMQSPR